MWGDTTVTFLGFLLNTILQIVCIPQEKVNKAWVLIQTMLEKKKVTIREMQQICGFLIFLCRCIIPGRAFTRKLYSYTGTMIVNRNGNKPLKPHHHIRVNAEIKADLALWLKFLSHPSTFCQPFMDFSEVIQADQVNFYTDSSGNKLLGCGGICENSWFAQKWDPDFISSNGPSIEYLEMYAVAVGVLLWIRRFANKRIVIFCDNISVVHMVNNSTSNCKNCLVLI